MQRVRVLSLALALASCGCSDRGAAPQAGSAAPAGQGRAVGPTIDASSSGAGPGGEAAAARESRRVVRGRPFGVHEVEVLLPGETSLQRLDLGTSLGRMPIVICYFRLGDSIGEKAFLALQEIALRSAATKLDVYGAVKPAPGMEVGVVARRLAGIGTALPVIVEREGFALGEALDVTESPSIGLIDAQGVLRLADARSLKQVVSGTSTLAAVIEWAAAGNPVPTIARQPRYYPVVELVGAPLPDFTLPRFDAEGSVSIADRRARSKDKLLGVLFWHPTCEHCRKVMPSIVAGSRAARKAFELISIVDVKDEADARETRASIAAQGIDFVVLQDERRRVHSLLNVVTTPTLLFVRPDGVVDSVYYSGDINYATVIRARVKAVLGTGGASPESGAPRGTAPP